MTERRYEEAWALVDRMVEELSEYPEFRVELEIFAAHRLVGDTEKAHQELERVARWEPDRSGAARVDRSMLAMKAWAAMYAPESAQDSAALARTALSSGTLVTDDTWYVTFEVAVWTLIAAGCYEEALSHLNGAIASLRAKGRLLRVGTLLPVRAELHRRCGRLRLADEDARISVQIVPREQIYAPLTASMRALVLIDQGQPQRARETLADHGYEDGIPSGGLADILWLGRGKLRIAEGDLAGGIEDTLRYGQISDGVGCHNPGYWPWRSMTADALVRLGRREEAIALAEAELELARAIGLRELEGAPLRTLGIAHGGATGIGLLQEAVTSLDGSPLVLDHARAQLELGIAMRLNRQPIQARAPLSAAMETASRIGAQPIAQRAHEELLASGARPRRTALRGIDALTPSERRVASLAAQGLTNSQIAQTLYATPKTVEAHLRNSYDKLQIASKRELTHIFDPDSGEPLAQTA